MGKAQAVMILLYGMNLGIAMISHGKPKTGTNNFWTTLFGLAINFSVLTWGGFWS